MKKYLMSGVAAIAFVAALTSCSSHDFEPMTPGEIAQVKYEQAFIKVFGQPSADQDWGFGTVNSTRTRANAAVTGDPFTFESTDSYYKTQVPDGATDINTVDNNTSKAADVKFATTDLPSTLNYWDGYHYIYINGNVTVPTGAYIASATFYVLPGATLTINKQANYECAIFVASGATLNYRVSKLESNDQNGQPASKSRIYNRGTVSFGDNFEANQNVTIYNEGTMTGKDITSKPADGRPSYFYNFGELALTGKLELNSCANFYNEGIVTVAGETSVTQQKIWWINKGRYTTGTMKFSAKNSTFYNFCQLLIQGNAHMYDGEFNLMANSYTEAGTADFDNFIVNMGDNSGFNVKGSTNWEAQGDGTYQGFKATGSKAYVRLGGTTTVAGHLHTLELTGNITYAINSLYDKGANNSGVQPTYVFNTGTIVAPFDKVTVTPNATGCGAIWIIDGGEEFDVRIIGEDLSATDATDFDFNDIVLDVKYTSDSEAEVTLAAAGGTLPLEFWSQGSPTTKYEVHELFGVATNVMVNTGRTSKSPLPKVTLTGLDKSKRGKDIIIMVNKGTEEEPSWVELGAKQGEPAAKIAVSPGFKFCMERISIKNEYPIFSEWVKDPKLVWY